MPFLPSCWQIGSRLSKWKVNETLDWDLSDALTLVHGDLAVDKEHRLDTDPRTAMLNRRIFGYIVDITAPTDVLGRESQRPIGYNIQKPKVTIGNRTFERVP